MLLAAAAVAAAPSDDPIRKVYVVFSNHLDVGYTENRNGSSAAAVINEYFEHHFPAAIATANEARAHGHPFRWMTQSWLVSAFRNCNATKINIGGPSLPSDLRCPNATALAAFEAAVRRKDIGWHAFPFNGEPELFTPALFDSALNLTFAEDLRSAHAPRRTLSLRDVPGLTRAAVPLLARRGVEAISVGENSQCAPAAVPPIFRWRDNATGSEVVAMFHALGYGGSFPSRRRLQPAERYAQTRSGRRRAFRAGRQHMEHELPVLVPLRGARRQRTVPIRARARGALRHQTRAPSPVAPRGKPDANTIGSSRSRTNYGSRAVASGRRASGCTLDRYDPAI